MWAPTPLMAWYCDQSHLIIRKRWTLSQSFTWFPLLPASLFPSLRLLSDTYAWFYSFITPAMSRYFSPRVYRRFFIFYFFSYGDAGVSLTPGATWSNLSRLFRRAVSSAVAGRILFYFFLLCWWELRRKEDIHMAEDTWKNDKRNKDEKERVTFKYCTKHQNIFFNLPVQWSVNAFCSSPSKNLGIKMQMRVSDSSFLWRNDCACLFLSARRQICLYQVHSLYYCFFFNTKRETKKDYPYNQIISFDKTATSSKMSHCAMPQIIWSPTKYTQCDSFKCTERISI